MIPKLNKETELFNESSSKYKDLQQEQFVHSDGSPMSGEVSRVEYINDKPVVVIYNFDQEGFLHSDEVPAIQYPGHWEYWKHGLIEKVVSECGDIEEIWKDGVPISIEKDLIHRRESGEDI